MLQCFHDADVGIMESGIFANKGNRYFFAQIFNGIHHVLPAMDIWLRAVKMKTLAYRFCQMFLFHGKRDFIQCLDIQILDYLTVWYVTEQGDFITDCFIERDFCPADDDVRLDSHSL